MDLLTEIEQLAAASWFSDEAAALAGGESTTSRQAAMLERSAPAGAMAPLCRRDEHESYRVLEGELTFWVDDYVVEAEAGDMVVVPPGAPRTFRAGSEGARWLVLTRVASLERFVDFGRAVSAPRGDPVPDWPAPEEMAAVASIAAANGIELLGPPGAVPAVSR